MSDHELIDHPPHYTSGLAECKSCEAVIECIDVTRHMNFNLGNAMKYIWRCDHKGSPADDLRKAIWYLTNEIERRKG